MRFIYFTKMLRELDLAGYVRFFKETGLDGADLAVRPGYPVSPDNVRKALPEAVKLFADNGLVVGLVTAPTSLTDAESQAARDLFEACGACGVPGIKIGYYTYRGNWEETLRGARASLAGFAQLARKTGVKACYHTHSGSYLGGNAAALRFLLQDLDPHHVGAFLDTGHTAVDGGPIQLEMDTIRPWLSFIAIKDMKWIQGPRGWHTEVVPVGQGIVSWNDFGKAVTTLKLKGTISLHGEYEAASLDERKQLARKELASLKSVLAS